MTELDVSFKQLFYCSQYRFYVRDLDHITQIIDKLVEYIYNDGRGANKILDRFLELCCLVRIYRQFPLCHK